MKLTERARCCAEEVMEIRGEAEVGIPFIDSRQKQENGLSPKKKMNPDARSPRKKKQGKKPEHK